MMPESCWERLGIDPTADTAVIKKAYAKQLKSNKPDKNPEGFVSLRAAYEQALEESWWYEEEERVRDYELVNDDHIDDSFEEKDFAKDGSTEKTADFHLVARQNSGDDKSATESLIVADRQDGMSESTNDNSENSIHKYYTYLKGTGEYPESSDSNTSSGFDIDDNEAGVEDVSIEAFEPVPYFYDSSSWTQEWQQIADDAGNSDADQRLQTLLQNQRHEPRSLDDQKDFEEALLVWFDDQPLVFPLSYQLAKSHFGWDKRLEFWSHNDYPWYLLQSLDERYEQVSYFQSPTAFYQYLVRYFPTIASYWPVESSNEKKNKGKKEDIDDPEKMKRRYVFKRLFFPFRVIELAHELSILDDELDYYSQQHTSANESALEDSANNSKPLTANDWRNHSSLATLNKWTFKRIIKLEDFGAFALVIGVILTIFSLLSKKSGLSFYYDGIGVFAVVSLYYLFWQLQLRHFATPDRFISKAPWNTGWLNASVLLFIMGYISWLDIATLDSIATPTSPIYFLTHLAGASLFVANSMRQDNKVVTAITWQAGVQLLIVAVLIPLFVVVVAKPPYTGFETLSISPLFWLFLAAPAFFVSLADTYTRLQWLENLGYKLLNILSYIMLIGILIVFGYSVDILYEMEFGFTAITLMIITLIMAIGKSKYLDSFDEK